MKAVGAHAHVNGHTRKIMLLERTPWKVEGQVPVMTWDGRSYFEKSTHRETSLEARGWADRKEEADGGDGRADNAMDTCVMEQNPRIGLERTAVSRFLPRLWVIFTLQNNIYRFYLYYYYKYNLFLREVPLKSQKRISEHIDNNDHS